MIAESRPSQATFLKEVDRAMGIEPATTCLEGRRLPLKTGLIVNPLDSKIGVKPG